MDKLDRLEWAAGTCFRAYGVRVGIRVNDPAALELLRESFPPLWKPTESPVVDRLYSFILGGRVPGANIRRFHMVFGNAQKLARSRELREALNIFEAKLQLGVAEESPRRVFVQAGVVSWGGKAIIIPGHSYAGKSTLVAALVRAGATYYSDEFAALDFEGLVHPYPRALNLRGVGGLEPGRYPVEKLGGRSGAKPIPVGLVLATRYKEGAGWLPRPLSPGRTMLQLLANAVPARLRPEKVLPTLRKAVLNADCIRSARGEADEVVEPILDRLGDGRTCLKKVA